MLKLATDGVGNNPREGGHNGRPIYTHVPKLSLFGCICISIYPEFVMQSNRW